MAVVGEYSAQWGAENVVESEQPLLARQEDSGDPRGNDDNIMQPAGSVTGQPQPIGNNTVLNGQTEPEQPAYGQSQAGHGAPGSLAVSGRQQQASATVYGPSEAPPFRVATIGQSLNTIAGRNCVTPTFDIDQRASNDTKSFRLAVRMLEEKDPNLWQDIDFEALIKHNIVRSDSRRIVDACQKVIKNASSEVYVPLIQGNIEEITKRRTMLSEAWINGNANLNQNTNPQNESSARDNYSAASVVDGSNINSDVNGNKDEKQEVADKLSTSPTHPQPVPNTLLTVVDPVLAATIAGAGALVSAKEVIVESVRTLHNATVDKNFPKLNAASENIKFGLDHTDQSAQANPNFGPYYSSIQQRLASLQHALQQSVGYSSQRDMAFHEKSETYERTLKCKNCCIAFLAVFFVLACVVSGVFCWIMVTSTHPDPMPIFADGLGPPPPYAAVAAAGGAAATPAEEALRKKLTELKEWFGQPVWEDLYELMQSTKALRVTSEQYGWVFGVPADPDLEVQAMLGKAITLLQSRFVAPFSEKSRRFAPRSPFKLYGGLLSCTICTVEAPIHCGGKCGHLRMCSTCGTGFVEHMVKDGKSEKMLCCATPNPTFPDFISYVNSNCGASGLRDAVEAQKPGPLMIADSFGHIEGHPDRRAAETTTGVGSTGGSGFFGLNGDGGGASGPTRLRVASKGIYEQEVWENDLELAHKTAGHGGRTPGPRKLYGEDSAEDKRTWHEKRTQARQAAGNDVRKFLAQVSFLKDKITDYLNAYRILSKSQNNAGLVQLVFDLGRGRAASADGPMVVVAGSSSAGSADRSGVSTPGAAPSAPPIPSLISPPAAEERGKLTNESRMMFMIVNSFLENHQSEYNEWKAEGFIKKSEDYCMISTTSRIAGTIMKHLASDDIKWLQMSWSLEETHSELTAADCAEQCRAFGMLCVGFILVQETRQCGLIFNSNGNVDPDNLVANVDLTRLRPDFMPQSGKLQCWVRGEAPDEL